MVQIEVGKNSVPEVGSLPVPPTAAAATAQEVGDGATVTSEGGWRSTGFPAAPGRTR